MSLLDDIVKKLQGLSPEEQKKLASQAAAATKVMKFVPNPGPQTEAYLSKADVLLYGGSAGSGKASSCATPVLTPFGWRLAGDIKTGDMICATDGTAQEVLAVFPQGKRPVYRLDWHDGTHSVVDENHLWLGWYAGRSRKMANIKTFGVDSARIWTTAQIVAKAAKPNARRFAAPLMSAPCKFNVAGESRGPSNFVPRRIPPYILGVLLGDGSLTGDDVRWTKPDIEIADRIDELLAADGRNVKVSRYAKNGEISTFRFPVASRMLEDLDEIGIWGKLATEKFIPRIYLFASVDERWDLLRGLMDTDGWVQGEGECCYGTSSRRLADDVAHLARSLGALASISTKQEPRYTYKGETLTGQPAHVVRIKMPNAQRMFTLQRKASRCAHNPPQSMAKFLDSITPAGEEETVCFVVSNPNRCYVIDGFTVTHNSTLELGWAINESRSAIIFRRERVQTDGLEKEGKRMIGSDARFNGQDMEWTWPDGKTVRLGGMKEPDSWNDYAGRERDCMCVGAGTMVLMGGGGEKPIEQIRVGDFVQTLEGPRAVERVYPVRRKECVRMEVIGDDGRVIASQVQSTTHAVLCEDGWRSAADQGGVCRPIPDQSACNTQRSSSPKPAIVSPHRAVILDSTRPVDAQVQGTLGCVDPSAMAASYRPASVRSDCVGFGGGTQVDRRPGQWFGLRALDGLRPLVKGLAAGLRALARAGAREPALSLPGGSMGRYWSGTRPYGVQPRRYPNRPTGREDDQECPLRSGDAGRPNPCESPACASADIRARTHQEGEYVHPYTREMRRVSLSRSMRCAALRFVEVGPEDVYDLQVNEVNHFITQAAIVNKNCFDEGGEFLEMQVAQVTAWLRAPPGQRTRVIIGSNPPRTAEGLWLVKWFAPWLDERFPDPASSGELRWAVHISSGDQIEVKWVEGPGQYTFDGETYAAKSYTFIPASLEDNPYRNTPEYRAQLQSLPEPLRSQLLYGKFTTSLKDLENQCIPTDWVRAAMERWKSKPPEDVPMCALGVDCSGGGEDPMVIAPRHDGWFAPLVKIPGKNIPAERAGAYAAGMVMAHRRDGAVVVVDMGGGYGGPVYEHLRANDIDAIPYKGAQGSTRRTQDGKLKFTNTRSAAYWAFREALDPGQPGGSPIHLPNDRRLLAGLTAPTFTVTPNGIQVEPKVRHDEKGKVKGGVKGRLGFSPDEADAVVMAWYAGARTSTHALEWMEQGGPKNKIPRQVNVLRGRTPLSAKKYLG